ncbi:NADAR family protein [Ferruginibacter sp.]|nr:NADAR family protein [Ferruginibacter sp.]
MKYSLNWLTKEIENDLQPEYLFFWGHSQKVAGITDKSCFSQWWPSPFIVDGTTYPTAEHWMMAKKALLFNDVESFDLIIAANKPAIAKDLGRKVKNFNTDIWNAKAFDLVTAGNLHKFSQHEDLKKFLLSTGNKILVEASPVDFIWGIGLSQDAKDAYNPFKWKGPNLLGFALMEVRDALKK